MRDQGYGFRVQLKSPEHYLWARNTNLHITLFGKLKPSRFGVQEVGFRHSYKFLISHSAGIKKGHMKLYRVEGLGFRV